MARPDLRPQRHATVSIYSPSNHSFILLPFSAPLPLNAGRVLADPSENYGDVEVCHFSLFFGPMCCVHGRLCRNFFGGVSYFGEKFEIDGTGTNEGAQNKNRTAKSDHILIRLKFVKVN